MTREQLKTLYNAYLEHTFRRSGFGRVLLSEEQYARLCAAVVRHWSALVHVRKTLTTPEQIRAGAVQHVLDAGELAHYRELFHRADKQSRLQEQ